jgi:hypothetical protein
MQIKTLLHACVTREKKEKFSAKIGDFRQATSFGLNHT